MDPQPWAAPGPATRHYSVWDAVAVFVAGFVLGVVAATVAYAVTGDPVDDPGWAVTAAAVFGQFGGFALGLWGVARRRRAGPWRDAYGLVLRGRDWWAVLVGIGLQIGLGILLLPLANLVDEDQEVVENLLDATGAELAVLVVAAGVLAPVLEELLFRGLLLRALLARTRPGVAIGVSAVAFAAVHLLDFSPGTLVITPALVVFGVVSGRFAVRTGELSRSILLHFGFNVLVVLGAVVS
jgi:membrane protease YdiL (CAAX protease family)